MEIESTLDNVVVFDIPAPYETECLCELLQAGRLAWRYERRRVPLVATALRADPYDLADLHRTVEGWAGERGLGALRFELDGRSYVLYTKRVPAL